jgi:hypothetical protein
MGPTLKVVTYAVLAVLASMSFVALAVCFPIFVKHARAGVMAIKGSARGLFTMGAAVARRAGARSAGMVWINAKRARAYSAVEAVTNILFAVLAEVTRVAVAFGEVGRHDAVAM